MPKIKKIFAHEILDSRGNPTIETIVELSDGKAGVSSVPSGASRGKHEAQELRDNNLSQFAGMGVLNAIENVNKIIAPQLLGSDVFDQSWIDRTMIQLDGTENKSKLGANAILSVSQAAAKAAAQSSSLPLFSYIRRYFPSRKWDKRIPTPIFNLLEGGSHASNALDFQEFLLVPASSKSYQENLAMGINIYHSLYLLLKEKHLSTLVADEGGFAPSFATNREALILLKQAIESSAYQFSFDAFMGLDAASSMLLINDQYKIRDKPTLLINDTLAEYYVNLFSEFSLVYLEDPFSDEDWKGWEKLHLSLAGKVLIVGDDLTSTNPYRLQLALNHNAIDGIVIKPNQIGTVSETLAVCEMAHFKNLKLIVSHRSGETADSFIADFAVGVGADFVKFGAPVRERVIKYNRLLDIERELQKS